MATRLLFAPPQMLGHLMHWPIEAPCRGLNSVRDRVIGRLLEMRVVWMPAVEERRRRFETRAVRLIAAEWSWSDRTCCRTRPRWDLWRAWDGGRP